MWFFISSIGVVILYKWINPPTTYLQLTCDCPKGSTFHKKWVDGSEISPYMKLAVVASEDNNFMKHGGIDWGAVEKAKKYNETVGVKRGKYRGASTISQQTAKNVFLWPGTSKWSKWIRKGFEVYFTYLIEFFWGKDRIMEVYLNVIEMGPCKFGIGAAAEDYFHTTPSKLSREQAALVAACLPNPVKYSVAKPGGYMQKRQGQIARLMRLIGDDYFVRYSDEVPDDKRVLEEKNVEKRIQEIPADELPERFEDDVAPEKGIIEKGKTEDEETLEIPEVDTPESSNDSI